MKHFLTIGLILFVPLTAFAGPYPNINCTTGDMLPSDDSVIQNNVGPFKIQIISAGSTFSSVIMDGAFASRMNGTAPSELVITNPTMAATIDADGAEIFNFNGSGAISDLSTNPPARGLNAHIVFSFPQGGDKPGQMEISVSKAEWNGNLHCQFED